MSAHWPVTNGEPLSEVPLRRVGLGTLLNATARRHPERLALIDPADKPVWSGRPAITWTYAAAAEIVARLATGMRGWRLAPGSRIGLCLPGGAESALAFLAVEAAGHIACPLPVSWDEEKLVAAAQCAGLSAILTQSRLGSVALAERLCNVAARYFGLRYLAAFGPDVPDGVINLDAMVIGGRGGFAASTCPLPQPGSLVTFAGGDPERPVHRTGGALVAAAAAHLVALRAGPNERILSLLALHDLRGLVTGLAAALVSGASLETLPLFDGAGLKAALDWEVPTHLVAPAFLERNLAGRDLPSSLRTLSLVHRAPARFSDRSHTCATEALRIATIVDAVAFDETAILSGRRGSGGDVALVLGRPERLALPGTLMGLRCEPDGRLAFRGQACATMPLQRGIPEPAPADEWRPIPYATLLYAGIATAVMAHADETAPDSFAPA